MDFTALDFETANGNRASACAIGIVRVKDDVVTEKKYWLIKPPTAYFSPFNIAIHGITAFDVKDQPCFDQLWPTLRDFLAGNMLVMHNAGFDIGVLRAVLDYYALPYPESEVACTWAISKKAWPNLASYRLDSVADFLGINFIHHNALEDAAACSQIASRACNEHKVGSLYELADKLGFVNGRLHPGGYQPVRHSLPRPKNQVQTNSTFHIGL